MDGKVVITIIIAIVFALGMTRARAEYIDLNKGKVTLVVPCEYQGKEYACVGVEKDEVKYLALIDDKGEFAIFIVEEGVEDPKPIWRRDWLRI